MSSNLDTPEQATQRLFRQFSSPSDTLETITEQFGGDRVEAIAQITQLVAGDFAQHFPPDEYHRRWREYTEGYLAETIRQAREVDPDAKIGDIAQLPNVQILSGMTRGIYRAMLDARRGPWAWPIS